MRIQCISRLRFTSSLADDRDVVLGLARDHAALQPVQADRSIDHAPLELAVEQLGAGEVEREALLLLRRRGRRLLRVAVAALEALLEIGLGEVAVGQPMADLRAVARGGSPCGRYRGLGERQVARRCPAPRG